MFGVDGVVRRICPINRRLLRNGVLGFAVGMILGLPARALEVGGTAFQDSGRLAESQLVANGGGVRSRAIFKVYAIVLYLPEKRSDAEAVLSAPGAKRLAIATLRDLTAQQFSDALRHGIEKNHPEAEFRALGESIRQFIGAMESFGEVPKGTAIHIDWVPGSGTRLTVAGKTLGKDIAGEDFYRALLRIWIGGHPTQEDLKSALLGKPAG